MSLVRSSLLSGNNRIPGEVLPKDLKEAIPRIHKACRDFGLKYGPFYVQMLNWSEMAEVASYGGFPQRYPHWQWGMEYEEMNRGYVHGNYRIYEMVTNANPAPIYCLTSNTYVDNVTVIAHALGHVDFFCVNEFFKNTQNNSHDGFRFNMLNEMGSHATRIRKYIQRWGEEEVGNFIDYLLSIDDLIDPNKTGTYNTYKDCIEEDKREYVEQRRFKVQHEYMNDWINSKEFKDKERKRAETEEQKLRYNFFNKPEKDIMGFLGNYAQLEPWQRDILFIMREESIYFYPQRQTKVINEGWASYVDFNIMARQNLAGAEGIIHYADHKAGVLGGEFSSNPYKLGFSLLMAAEDRWNKGKFGRDWEDCKNMHERENWDRKLGLGKEKVFELRKSYNDVTLISELFDQTFCDDNQFFEWEKLPNGETKIISRDAKRIRSNLLERHVNAGLPDIRLVDPNHKDKNIFLLQHYWEGRTLLPKDTIKTLDSLYFIWKRPVVLATQQGDEDEILYVKNSDKEAEVLTRKEYDALTSI